MTRPLPLKGDVCLIEVMLLVFYERNDRDLRLVYA